MSVPDPPRAGALDLTVNGGADPRDGGSPIASGYTAVARLASGADLKATVR